MYIYCKIELRPQHQLDMVIIYDSFAKVLKPIRILLSQTDGGGQKVAFFYDDRSSIKQI